jgi:hypothetical protein
MTKILLFCIVLGFMLSCKEDVQEEDGVYVSLRIHLTIESTDGIDLLNPNTPNAIREDNIRMFYEIDGKRETYASTSNAYILDNPSGFTLNTPVISTQPIDMLGNKYFLTIFSNSLVSNNSITVLAFSGKDAIKLRTEVLRTNGSIRVTKVWYENILVWPIEGNDGPPYVRIILAPQAY